jgi:hypothetical protein
VATAIEILAAELTKVADSADAVVFAQMARILIRGCRKVVRPGPMGPEHALIINLLCHGSAEMAQRSDQQ